MSLASQVGLLATRIATEVKGKASRTGGGREAVAAASGTSGTVTLDASAASIFTLNTAGNVGTLNITNVPASGIGCAIRLCVTFGGNHSIATPSGGIFYGAATPSTTAASGKKAIYDYFTVDGGTSWHCSGVMQA